MSYTSQNKILPGVYTNFTTTLGAFVPGKRGVVALPARLGWGEAGRVLEVEESTLPAQLGYRLDEPEMLPLRLILQNAHKVLVYRLEAGTAARYTEEGGVSLLAACGGSRGNALSVQIATETGGGVTVTTRMADRVMDIQQLERVEDFRPCGWVSFGEGSTLEPGIYHLQGGEDGAEEADALDRALDALLLWDGDTICGWGLEEAEQAKLIPFVDRALREDKPIQCVVTDRVADNQNVLSVRQSLVEQGGTVWSPEAVCCWLAGFTAGAGITQSGTYAIVAGAADVSPRYTKLMQEQAVLEGQCVFDVDRDGVRLVYDINTLRTFNEKHPKSFRKNKIVRVLYTVDRDIKAILRREFLGKVPNSADGRSRVKGRLAEYLTEIQRQGAIEGFAPAEDLEVLGGEDVDAIVVNYAIQPVDTGDKFYLTAQVR